MNASLTKNKIVKDIDGNIKSTTQYDEKGNIIYASGDVEVIKDYDEVGRLTHYKDSTGREHWYTYTVDEEGNSVQIFKNSDGFTDVTVLQPRIII